MDNRDLALVSSVGQIPTCGMTLSQNKLANLLGTVHLMGTTRHALPTGIAPLSSAERSDLIGLAEQIMHAISGDYPDKVASSKAKLLLLHRMVLSYPGERVSERAAEGRAELYQTALMDVPAWALKAALDAWAKGKAEPLEGKEWGAHNFDWAPSPARLLALCERTLTAYKNDLRKIESLLKAVTMERALDPTPLDPQGSPTGAPGSPIPFPKLRSV